MNMECSIESFSFNGWQRLGEFESHLDLGYHGAQASFVGSMRGGHEDEAIGSLYLDYYPGMTESALRQLCRRAGEHWSLHAVLLQHRVGEVYPGEHIVVVGCWARHRREAFEACRWLMEHCKSDVPLWKKETLLDGRQHWVQGNTPGY